MALCGIQTPDPQTGGETLKLMAYFIQYNGQIYKMVGLTAPNADFNIYFKQLSDLHAASINWPMPPSWIGSQKG